MIRVLYISNEDKQLGGSSLSLLDMLESLGEQVDPIILFMADGPVCHCFRDKGYRCLVHPFYRNSFSAKGWRRVVRFLPHGVARFFIQRRCIRLVTNELNDVDLVHTNSSTVDIGLRIANKLRVPHLWHLREYYDIGLGGKPFPSWASWKRKLFSSDAVIAITPGLFSHWNLGTHPKAYCIPDAVCRLKDAKEVRLERNGRVLFVAGKISRVKRPDEALRIFAGSQLPKSQLCLIGTMEADLKNELDILSEKLNIRNKLIIIPFISDVMSMMREASAVLVCTQNEGMGRVAVEAMFAGCPVVARNSGGSHDVLKEGELGQLYNSVEEGTLQLQRAVTSPLLEQLKKAQEEAMRDYSVENYGQRILSVYQSLLCHDRDS